MTTNAPLAPDMLSADTLSSPEGIANPYPVYRALRASAPVRYVRLPASIATGRTQPVYSWALMSYEDILTVTRDPVTFSSNTMSVFKAMPYMPLAHDDPPRHTQLRRLVNKAFSPARIADLSGWISQLAHERLDGIGRGPVEFMQAYATPLPIWVITRMLGVPKEDYPSFKVWSEAFVAYTGMPAAERGQKMQELARYMTQALAARRAQPAEDLLSALAEAEVEGSKLSDEEIRGIATLLLIAGNETTTNLLGNMMGLLADRPELWQRAREDRSLVEPIIEEVLRYESPAQRIPRLTTRPVRLGGVDIGAGELVDMCLGAANRDPAVFDDPDSFRPERKNNAQHLAFSHGTHFCLGAPLTRLEARLSLDALLDRFSSVRRGEEPAVRQSIVGAAFGYRSLPLVLG
jgi:cytochrome P450